LAAASVLDLVLPCYNPLSGWEQRVLAGYREVAAALPHRQVRLILVNDGSARGVSASNIDTLKTHIPHFTYLPLSPNEGKGAALRQGMAQAQGEHSLFTDIDFPYTLQSLLAIVTTLEAGAAVAIGIKDKSYYEQLPAFRVRISKFLRWLARTFLRLSVTDTQCGLKGFDARGREVFLQTTIERYLADLEFVFLVDQRRDLDLVQVEVKLRDGVEFSQVNLRVLITEGFNFLKVMLRAWFRPKAPAAASRTVGSSSHRQ
jgi:glycosyltransferase involved in cell wall biosynthesis